MASWHLAQRAWERTQPQLFFEVDADLASLPVARLSAPASPLAGKRPAETIDGGTNAQRVPGLPSQRKGEPLVVAAARGERPPSTYNNEAGSAQSLSRTRALPALEESSHEHR